MVQAFSCLLHKLPTGFTGKRRSPEAALGTAAVWCDGLADVRGATRIRLVLFRS